MFDDFIFRASLAGLGVAIAAAPLGCFIIWRRMAFFGDATAHAAILGVALSLTLSMPIFAGVLVVSLLMALAVATMSERVESCLTLHWLLGWLQFPFYRVFASTLWPIFLVTSFQLAPLTLLLFGVVQPWFSY